MGAMPPDHPTDTPPDHDSWGTLKRFIPYLWPKDDAGLRWRIVGAFLFKVLFA